MGPAGQEGFDQQLAEAGQARAAIPEDRFLPDDICNLYPRLSGQDRSLIETAICTAYVRGEADLRSGYACANTLARLANNLGSEGRSIAWLNDNQLRDYVKNSFPRGAYIVRALDYVREVRQQAGLQVAQASGVPRNHIQGQRDNQSAPLAFVQVAFDPEQIREAELRRVLDHLDGQSTPSAVSVASGELDRLEKELLDELRGGRDDHPGPSFSVDPEEFTFNLEQFSPGELRRLLDESIPSPVPVDPEDSALNSGQSPPNELWRLLNDEPAPLGVASSSGPLDQPDYEPGPLPALSMYLPLGFQHGPQWASEDFMQGMRLHKLLPSASQPETNFPLKGVNYTATLGPPGHEDQVFLRPT
ncbi:hypothetical protein [Bradyrhizobium neotropicale]|uniref:hypothetical protein n=1 Tax=Bradyrhizobium neotropicale TaxID=1497615 RepID=UPI001AD66D17|nr:hypothetical protein [Bradyrhizobium neotropicale]MBO4227516.1 hypothetical protein [Bradyrhizobium neotropicale]